MKSKFLFYTYIAFLIGVGIFLFIVYGASGHNFNFEEEESLKYFIFSVSFLSTAILFLISSFFVKLRLIYIVAKVLLLFMLCLLLLLLGILIYFFIKQGGIWVVPFILIFLALLTYQTIRYLLQREFWIDKTKATH